MPELPPFLDSAYKHFDQTTPVSSSTRSNLRASRRMFYQGFYLGSAVSAFLTTVVLAILFK
jgi:hypothetical protein